MVSYSYGKISFCIVSKSLLLETSSGRINVKNLSSKTGCSHSMKSVFLSTGVNIPLIHCVITIKSTQSLRDISRLKAELDSNIDDSASCIYHLLEENFYQLSNLEIHFCNCMDILFPEQLCHDNQMKQSHQAMHKGKDYWHQQPTLPLKI